MRFTYPNGLDKALTFSYDDGRVFDRKLVEIFNRYGVKGTFHLNSGTLGQKTESGDFVTPQEVKELYQGHEVACHTVTHLQPLAAPVGQVAREIAEDRKALEKLTGGLVQGLSYPFGRYSPEIIQAARAQGIKYSRTVVSTRDFHVPADFMEWHPTCHHGDPKLMDLGKQFLGFRGLGMMVMYVWGHSFEFAWTDSWKIIEDFAAYMGGREDLWYCTNMELCQYVEAIRAQEFSADGKLLYNPTAQTVWFETAGKVDSIAPGEFKPVE